MNTKDKLKEIFKNNLLTVISTVNLEQKPESAVIGFVENEDLTIFFGTYVSSRKYKNIQNNPNISLVIGWDEGKTVQYEGTASEITDSSKLIGVKEIFRKKNPDSERFESEPNQRYFKILPNWIRYTDLSQNPEEIIELGPEELEKII